MMILLPGHMSVECHDGNHDLCRAPRHDIRKDKDEHWEGDWDFCYCAECGGDVYGETDRYKNIKLFRLVRKEDESGVSGTGIVGVGIQFPTGKCVMEWVVAGYSISLYDSSQILLDIHGHEGKTVLEWLE